MADVEFMCICSGCDSVFYSTDNYVETCDKCAKSVDGTAAMVKRVYELEEENARLQKALCEHPIMDADRRKIVIKIWTVLYHKLRLVNKDEYAEVLASAQNYHVTAQEVLEVAKYWTVSNE